ncbi:MAG: hypothetical protein ACI9MC_001652 [Kiritimatiellia bacterium]|jgi:hypothetical protein
MNPSDMYDLVYEASRQAFREEMQGNEAAVISRMATGKVVFVDGDGRTVREVPIGSLLTKVTSVREKLRVLEQKINNHKSLNNSDRAELQVYLTKAYGSLTTFNFLFRDDDDKFQGTGGQ